MTDCYNYTRKKRDFGRHPQFEETETKILGSVMPNPGQRDNYMLRNPNKLVLDNIPMLSEHSVSLAPFATGRL